MHDLLHPAKQGGAKVEQGGADRQPRTTCSTTLPLRGGGGGGAGGGGSGRVEQEVEQAMDDRVVSGAGQMFKVVGSQPHICADGRETFLRIWRGKCATCGAFFDQAQVSFDAGRFNKRCEKHRRPGSIVRKVKHG